MMNLLCWVRLASALFLVPFLSTIHLLAVAPTAVAHNLTDIDPSLQWGPFRPNHYLGLRPLASKTLLMGLMWANATTDIKRLNLILRDRIDPAHGGIKFGWQSYDPRNGGTQMFWDFTNGLNLTTHLIKSPYGDLGSGHWGIRVSGTPTGTHRRQKTHLIWHIAMEGLAKSSAKKSLQCDVRYGRIVCSGQDQNLGKFNLRLVPLDGNRLAEKPKIFSDKVSDDVIWDAQSIYIQHVNKTLNQNVEIYGIENDNEGNIYFLQLVLVGAFAFDVIFTSTSYQVPFNSSVISSSLLTAGPKFASNFHHVFPITSPFIQPKYSPFSRWLLSNLLAGMGYFEGEMDLSTLAGKHEDILTPAIVETAPENSLLTFTPSRKHLPQGFLWHEGFHLLVVLEWDLDLAVEVLYSWLSNMDENGWIASRQVLGPEVQSTLSLKDRVQEIDVASPPSILAIALPKLLAKLKGDESYRGHFSQLSSNGTNVMEQLYPLLKKYYVWFRDNQKGDMTNYGRDGLDPVIQGYRWRDCVSGGCPASGLGDYPRPDPENKEDALHVDALAWMGASAQAMASAAEYLGKSEDVNNFNADLASAWKTLGEIHWDEDAGAWCDATATATAPPIRECHLGYVSLMPMLLGVVDPVSDRTSRIVDLLKTEKHIWSDYGLRSLSPNDSSYGSGTNVWRGNVWVNFNVLACLRLKQQGDSSDTRAEATTLALDLRKIIIDTVYKVWRENGNKDVWESYSDRNGAGGTVDGFTGWTSLLLLVLGMVRDEAGVVEQNDALEAGLLAEGEGMDQIYEIQHQQEIGSVYGSPRRGGFDLSFLFLGLGSFFILMVIKRPILELWRRVMGYEKRDVGWESVTLRTGRVSGG